LHALSNAAAGGNGVYLYGTGGGFPNASYNSTNYWVDIVFSSTLGPTLIGTTPGPGASGVSTVAPVSATFNEAVQATTITFTLKDANNQSVPATVSYDGGLLTATLTPTAALAGN